MDTKEKLSILCDAAKYDVSCSTSGSARKAKSGELGNAQACGICHSWSADGRCVSMLKVLLSNACVYDCAYCVNRRSNDVHRATFEEEELVHLILDFYRRNYIEGAFLSSGVIGCPDATMERFIRIAKTLRKRERWNGYLHIKAIPGASDELINEAALYADRISVNIELPSAHSLSLVAPDKTPKAIFSVMRALSRASGFEPQRLVQNLPAPDNTNLITSPAQKSFSDLPSVKGRVPEPRPLFDTGNQVKKTQRVSVKEARKSRYRNPEATSLPAGQTTQLVVGASPESDAAILTLSENLYLAYDVRRVYYSAFIPVSTDPRVPSLSGPPLLREHRLYQADWLFRFYGFRADEILDNGHPNLDADVDPKCSWAIRHPELFPVEVNTADYLELLRVPGIGPVTASRIVRSRRVNALTSDTIRKMGVVMKRAQFFITCKGKAPVVSEFGHSLEIDSDYARYTLQDKAKTRINPYQSEFSFE